MKALFTIVGMKHCGADSLIRGLPTDEPLTLVREPTNQHDKNAVQVHIRDRRVGYIKATDAVGLARWLDDAGNKSMNGKLVFGGNRLPMAEVEK